MSEEWRPVVGWEDRYEVSSLGNVRSIFNGRYKPIKLYVRSDGYVTVGLHRDGYQDTQNVHRLVCEAFNGPPPSDKHHAAHRNGLPCDNRRENLSWKTPAENLADKVVHGTHNYGETHGMAQIDAKTVVEVFRLRAAGRNLKDIANTLGIHFTHVSDIVRRNVWRHIDVPVELLTAAQAVDGRKRMQS